MIAVMISLSALALSAVRAEPSSAMKFLMDDPVSMLDWGIFHLERSLEKRMHGLDHLPDDTWSQSASVNYDWEKNRLTIEIGYTLWTDASLHRIKKPREAGFREAIATVVNSVQEHLWVSHAIDPIFPERVRRQHHDFSALSSMYFSHRGFEKKKEPENLAKEMDQITEIWVTVKYPGSDSVRAVTGTSYLTGKKGEILFRETAWKARWWDPEVQDTKADSLYEAIMRRPTREQSPEE